ncbi:MAG: translation initiation factor IF-2 N-terminal domain-containing protein, partial [Hyphomicrobiales bacterium]|nr:translation initiation factor IF-2 N-terminal domain-containing protein [Hyphomicrobiales bacterium]
MSETKNPGEKTLSVAPKKKTLTLNRNVEQGTVRQSFSHGRTKAVVVEKKKRRITPPGQDGKPETVAEPAPPSRPEPVAVAVEKTPAAAPATPQQRSGMVLRQLTEDEIDARAQALADARTREAEERRQAEEEARHRAEEEARLAAENAEAERRKAEEETRRQAEEETRRKAEQVAGERSEAPIEEPPAPSKPAAEEGSAAKPDKRHGLKPEQEESDDERRGVAKAVKKARPAEAKPAVKRGDERRRGKLTLSNALDEGERARSLASIRRRREKERSRLLMMENREKISREVVIPETITIQELANRMAERAVDVIKFLMKQGQMLKINDVIDADLAQLIAEEMGHSVKRVAESDVEEGLFGEADTGAALKPRPPVVTIMGHV